MHQFYVYYDYKMENLTAISTRLEKLLAKTDSEPGHDSEPEITEAKYNALMSE